MTSGQRYWASSLFKGRIGEAVVEVVLSEFGYQVSGFRQEYHRLGSRNGSGSRSVLAPDLPLHRRTLRGLCADLSHPSPGLDGG